MATATKLDIVTIILTQLMITTIQTTTITQTTITTLMTIIMIILIIMSLTGKQRATIMNQSHITTSRSPLTKSQPKVIRIMTINMDSMELIIQELLTRALMPKLTC